MSLEDQIARMGDARAAHVATPSWRDRAGDGSRWGWWVGAAAALAIIAGSVAWLAGDGTDAETRDAPAPLVRWVPASGVERIEYPSVFWLWTGGVLWPEVALITPGGRTDVTGAETTRILGGSSPYRRARPADDFRITERDGVLELDLTRSDGEFTEASIETGRFSAEQLTERAPELLPIAAEIDLLAAAIAAWDPALSVAYLGEPVAIDAGVDAGDSFDNGVFWLVTESEAQFAATYGSQARWIDYFVDLFALENADGLVVTEEYFGFVGDGAPRSVDEREWLAIVDELLGPDPQVTFPGSELFAMDPGAPDLARPAAEAFVADNGHWTVRLNFPEPTRFRDGGAIDVSIGAVTLTFGPADPGVEFTSLAVPSRLAEAEAKRYAAEINEALADPAPPTTTADPYPTVATISTVCSADSTPTEDVLDVAVHLAFDRTPLDLDQDGIDDELLAYDDADGTWWLIARLHTGWTPPLDIGQPSVPGLAQTPDGVAAGTDLDGDGGLEFFVTGYLGETAQMVSLRGCELVDQFLVDSPPGSPGATFGVQLGLDPASDVCSNFCFTRVSCTDGVLTQEVVISTLPPVVEDPYDISFSWGRGEVRLSDGQIELTELPSVTGIPIVDLPPDAPDADSTGVIDCTP